MKMRTLFLAALFAVTFAATAAHAGKMDLMLRMGLADGAHSKAMLGKSLSLQGGVEMVDLLLKSSDPELTAVAIDEAGGTVRSVIGGIMTASVPVVFLPELEGLHEVEAIEASKRLRLYMDSARANTGADDLQDGSYDGTSYDGENVVVGVIDSGLDYSRDDFMAGTSSDSRVQYLRFQSVSGGSVSITECANDSINDGQCTISASNDATVGHGTHVTGIAAGNGGGTNYIGMAPMADIMLVRNDFDDDIEEGTGTFTSGVLDGVDQIFTKSDIIDKPAVVNISQGTHIGAHDDTSLLEQGINSAVLGQYSSTGKSYGRSVVVAAGNEHIVEDALPADINAVSGGIHVPISVAASDRVGVRFWVLDPSSPGRTPLILDAWFSQATKANCTVAAFAYPRAQFNAADTGNAVAELADMAISTDVDSVSDSSPDNVVTISAAVDSSDSQNSKGRALFAFGPGSAGSWNDVYFQNNAGYFLDIVVEAAAAGSCAGNMWVEGGGTYVNFMKDLNTVVTSNNVTGTGGYGIATATALEGDNDMSVGLPGTASGVVTVGAYLQPKPAGTTRSEWTDADGTTYDATDINEPAAAQINGGTINQRSPFSSIGPTADGRTKPDLVAPGDPVISVLPTGFSPAAAVTVDSTHYKSQGTSQATPVVAGAVALLYQKNNTLTAAQVKNALTTGAAAAMGLTKDNEVGAGRIATTSMMGSVSADTSGYSGTGNLTESDIDGGGGGGSSSSGCGGTIVPAGHASAGASALLVLLPGLLIALRRRRS